MKINKSNVAYSSIVGIGEKIKQLSKETGKEYLELNRGVNAVTRINLQNIKPLIDYNSKEFQIYAPNRGFDFLRQSIVNEYFPDFVNAPNIKDNISITPGGMPALDLVIQILGCDNVFLPKFHWGSYNKMITLRKKSFSFYDNLGELSSDYIDEKTPIIICDPNNPTGIKMDDNFLLEKIKFFNNLGVPVIFDSPYRKLFTDNDLFFNELAKLENVIITESFSKWVGLPGSRIGFIYSNNKEFNDELNIRLLYEFNGVSSPSQILINSLLSTNVGQILIKNFKELTTLNIRQNIDFLYDNGLLVKEIYGDSKPEGIFAIINKSEDELLKNQIGAVGLDKFVFLNKEKYKNYSRICVSVPSSEFTKYFLNMKKNV